VLRLAREHRLLAVAALRAPLQAARRWPLVQAAALECSAQKRRYRQAPVLPRSRSAEAAFAPARATHKPGK
jgi:hypothetical protein